MSRKESCPHCDSPKVHSMPLRPHDGDSAVAWYECGACGRMWSVRKHAAENPTISETGFLASNRRAIA